MKKIFMVKTCNQCGWELGVFSRQSFCSEQCASIWDRDIREREEYQQQRLFVKLNEIREERNNRKSRSLIGETKEKETVELAEKPSFKDICDNNRNVEVKPKVNFKHASHPSMMQNNLDDLESEILDKTADIWSTFTSLEQTHPSDINDMADAIHAIQKIIAMRHIRRTMPEIFPIKK